MRRSMPRVWPFLLALTLLAAPAGAEVYRVTLNNGQVFETGYQPQEASWDASMVLLMTDVGNWIGVSKADIQQVENMEESGGYGMKIAAHTYEIGISPNDLAEAEAELAAAGGAGAGAAGQAADTRVQMLQLMLQQQQTASQQRQAEQSYTVQQFVEPNATQGLPSRFIGTPSGNNSNNQ